MFRTSNPIRQNENERIMENENSKNIFTLYQNFIVIT